MKVLTKTPVGFPLLARLNRVEGVVTIRFLIDDTGHVIRTEVAKSAESLLLDQLSRDPSLLKWTFQPATLDGKAVPSSYDQEFEFKLDPQEEKSLAIRRLALPIGTPDPPYPQEEASRHLQGSTTIGVRWSKEGLVDKIMLVKSSGAPALDGAALKFAYENWRIDPAATSPEKNFVKTVKFALPPSQR